MAFAGLVPKLGDRMENTDALQLLRSWSMNSMQVAVQDGTLPLRTIYVGLLRMIDTHVQFFVDAKFDNGTIKGGPGITLLIALDKAEVRFSAHSSAEAPVIKIVLRDAPITSGRDAFIEIGPTLRYG